LRLGFIGTGLMGRPMAARLLDAGHELTVWNRSRGKAEPLAERDAKLAREPAEVFAFGEATVTMLTDAEAVTSVLTGDRGMVDLEGRTLLQMSTIAPSESRRIASRVATAGGDYLEAPVLGSTPQAEAGELIVMAGGPEPLFERWRPVLAIFGANLRRVGEIGQAAALKLALNQLIAAQTAAFSFSLGLVRRSEIPVDTFMEILRASPLYAQQFDKKLPRLLDGDFSEPHFPLVHLRKDVALCAAAGESLGLISEPLEGLLAAVDRGIAMGLGAGDYSALHDAINPRNGRAET
jgi:3-hydroxyisobutyrate dehydrogenase-like beta-hydroxyacid dehydrogenase